MDHLEKKEGRVSTDTLMRRVMKAHRLDLFLEQNEENLEEISLQDHLKEDGRILIGDIAFETREKLDQCRLEAADEWDDEEIYFVADELRRSFSEMSFTQVSYCAGIITLPR